jgi:hypothetical protein
LQNSRREDSGTKNKRYVIDKSSIKSLMIITKTSMSIHGVPKYTKHSMYKLHRNDDVDDDDDDNYSVVMAIY